MAAIHETFSNIVGYAILLFELMGVAVLIVSGVRAIYRYIKHDALTQLNLAKGMATALEFKLGSEILRTVVVRDANELLIAAGVIALRAALAFLIHWEIHEQEKAEVLKRPPGSKA